MVVSCGKQASAGLYILGERKLRALATAEQKLILAGEDVDSLLWLPGKKWNSLI